MNNFFTSLLGALGGTTVIVIAILKWVKDHADEIISTKLEQNNTKYLSVLAEQLKSVGRANEKQFEYEIEGYITITGSMSTLLETYDLFCSDIEEMSQREKALEIYKNRREEYIKSLNAFHAVQRKYSAFIQIDIDDVIKALIDSSNELIQLDSECKYGFVISNLDDAKKDQLKRIKACIEDYENRISKKVRDQLNSLADLKKI